MGAARALDRLLTQGVAALMAQGLVTLERVAQDGARVRASAGAASFRRRKTLAACLAAAAAQAISKERAATAECVNAQARNRGLRQLCVRGLAKARTLALWYAVAHNLARAIALGAVAGLLPRG